MLKSPCVISTEEKHIAMSIDGFWYFYKVEAAKFDAVQSEFERASVGCPTLPEVPEFPLRLPLSFGLKTYAKSFLAGVLSGDDLGKQTYHQPFEAIAFRIIYYQSSQYRSLMPNSSMFDEDDYFRKAYQIPEEESVFTFNDEDLVGAVAQNRMMPPIILLMGIGRERFSQLPGYFGNLLIHPTAIDPTLERVFHLLAVDWNEYRERAICALAYSSSDGEQEAADVREILEALPNALEEARSAGTGLLAVTSWGCP